MPHATAKIARINPVKLAFLANAAVNQPEWGVIKESGSPHYIVKSRDDTKAVCGTFHRSMALEIATRLNQGKKIPLTVITYSYGRA